MVARGHRVQVVQPLPRTPGPLSRGRYAEIAAMPAREVRGEPGVMVMRPKYWHLPSRARGNAKRFAAKALAVLDGLERPDAVVCDYAWPAAALAPALARRGIACLINGRGSDVLEVAGEAGLGSLLAEYLRSAGHWCAVSQDLVDAMDRVADRPGTGVLVPNGVDTERFVPRDRGRARAALGIPADKPMVLVVGHLIPRKDPLLALQAFVKGAPQDALLCFIGLGPLADELKAKVSALGMDERVELLGERPPEELAEHWYAACDLLLLTSSREGRPNVVLEALASGRPVLATDAGGTAEILPEARMLGESRDPDQLGRQLAALLSDPTPSRELVASVAPLSWSRSLESLEQCLERAQADTRG